MEYRQILSCVLIANCCSIARSWPFLQFFYRLCSVGSEKSICSFLYFKPTKVRKLSGTGICSALSRKGGKSFLKACPPSVADPGCFYPGSDNFIILDPDPDIFFYPGSYMKSGQQT
jgi:hypothetical protein